MTDMQYYSRKENSNLGSDGINKCGELNNTILKQNNYSFPKSPLFKLLNQKTANPLIFN